MTFGFIAAASVASVAAFTVTAGRVVGFKRLIKYATITDVVFTVSMAVMFAGTFTGFMVAIMAGLMMAMMLTAVGYLLRLFDKSAEPVDDEHDAQGNWIYNQAPYVNA